MRSALCSALLCGVAFGAAAQERVVTFEETPPVTVTGFAVGRADYDRLVRTNSFTAGKIGVSLFKPAGDVYLTADFAYVRWNADFSWSNGDADPAIVRLVP